MANRKRKSNTQTHHANVPTHITETLDDGAIIIEQHWTSGPPTQLGIRWATEAELKGTQK
jgi:hypothetical protein